MIRIDLAHPEAWPPEFTWSALPFERTAQPFGGERSWLVCEGCGSRRRVLYLGHWSGARGRCCVRVRYRRTAKGDRRLRDLQKMRQRLGGSLSVLNPIPTRPKGMWWRKYYAWQDRYREIEAEWCRDMATWLAARKAAEAAMAEKLHELQRCMSSCRPGHERRLN